MTKEDNLILADEIRTIIRQLRKKGYTYRVFFTAINYKPVDFYNFMSHGYKMKDDNLMILKGCIQSILDNDEGSTQA